MEEFLALYSEAGMIGVVGAMFVFMVYQNAKRAEQQAEDLEALKIENEGQSKNIENIEQIVIKFLDRWNRSDETRDRRHEDMVKEVNDLSDVMMEVKGQVSRINGKWNGQFKSYRNKYKFGISILDRYYIGSINVCNVFSTDLLFVFKNQKDKGVINGL